MYQYAYFVEVHMQIMYSCIVVYIFALLLIFRTQSRSALGLVQIPCTDLEVLENCPKVIQEVESGPTLLEEQRVCASQVKPVWEEWEEG